MADRPIKDEDGTIVKEGDFIRFSYGIPPVVVRAEIIARDGKLIALTPGHKPDECSLRQLRRHVGNFSIDPCGELDQFMGKKDNG